MTHHRRNGPRSSAAPCSVLSAHVHGISLVHEVRATLAVANQGSDEGGAAFPHLVQIVEHRVAPCERPGCLTDQREEIRHEPGQVAWSWVSFSTWWVSLGVERI